MSEGTWLQCTITGNLIGPRYGCAECRIDDQWYVFGGARMTENGGNHYYDDIFVISLKGSTLTSTKLVTSGVAPGARVGACLVQYGNFLYLYGGTANEYTLEHVPGLYKFDFSSRTWYEVKMHDDPCIVSHSISVSRNVLYLFGGLSYDEPSNKLYTLSLTKTPLTWNHEVTRGTAPLPRVDHCSTILDNRLFVFGGSGSHVLWYNDMHVLDLTNMTWSRLKVSSEVYPSPCDFSSLSSYSNYLLLHGGSNDSAPDISFNKMWYYSIGSNSWYKCEVLGVEPPTRHVHNTTVYGNLIYVLGGLNSSQTLQDCWVLQLHENNMRGRVLAPCKIENPDPPTKHFKIDETIPVVTVAQTYTIPDSEKHQGLVQLKEAVLEQIGKGFDALQAQYDTLYSTKEKLAQDRQQLEKSKEVQEAWILEQRNDLVRQCEEHTEQCRAWAELQTEQFGKERTLLTEERKRLERAQRKLAADQDILNKRVKKLEDLISKTQIR